MSAESAKSHISCLPLIVVAAFFMECPNTTIATAALPRMARDCHPVRMGALGHEDLRLAYLQPRENRQGAE
ncbi:hypothetical protein [Collimonas humicola]|uniref:hypothetical protein n=1 Tax=Collimonas humicola TaxID=2825886 RepID=UPI001B8B8543|nr:hypothetical protein [Collimonas humicola]